MPVRSRSRASISARKPSQPASMARSSSSWASKPGRITPPSRIIVAGSSSSVADSRSPMAGSMSAACASCCSAVRAADSVSVPATSSWACSCETQAPRTGRLSRSATSSRGRALPSMMRDAIRSMSAACESSRPMGCAMSRSSSSATSAWRACTAVRSCSGASSHWRSSRLPAAVAQTSIRDSSVGPCSSCSGRTSSRFRRATWSMMMCASRRTRSMGCRCRKGWPMF